MVDYLLYNLAPSSLGGQGAGRASRLPAPDSMPPPIDGTFAQRSLPPVMLTDMA